jgi:membrane glycosyltransferase
MPDRSTSPLACRRALFALLVVAAIGAILGLASVAVPPRSVGAVGFLLLFAVTLPWTVIGFWNAAIGLIIMRCARDPVAAVNPLVTGVRGDEPIVASTAILMCVRNEKPHPVVRNLRPLVKELADAGLAALFHVYLLSDSDDSNVVAEEEACFGAFAANSRDAVPMTYRRRLANVGFKAGNIHDFCERWGGRHEFAITMDADSFLPAHTVLRLVRILQANPTLGILQTLAIGLPSASAFARLFQFGMRLGMHAHTVGAAWWQGDCGPYWGHNAILRLKPFIAHCQLPKLPERGPLGDPLLSHDQVEAALMRRAGYEVRVLPEEATSWEENPPTLIEFIRRDLRWCHGNMQYWRLLKLPGLKPVSRFQLAFAILMYLGSPAWMAMMALGAVAIASGATVTGPRTGASAALFWIMVIMIFAPKIASSLDVLATPSARRAYGGSVRFLMNIAAEALFSFLSSPVVAFSQTMFLIRLFLLRRGGAWTSQTREIQAVPWRVASERFWPHTLAGLAILAIVATHAPGGIFYRLMIAGGLALSIPFAVASSWPWLGAAFARLGIGRIPEETDPPATLVELDLPALEAAPPRAALAAYWRSAAAKTSGRT